MVDHPKRSSGEFPKIGTGEQPVAIDPPPTEEEQRRKELSRSSGQGYGEIRSYDEEQREKQVLQVKARFAYNSMRPEDVLKCETIYRWFSEVAEHIVRHCPDNRERATALTELMTARMYAINSITASAP